MSLKKVVYNHCKIDHRDERRALFTAFNGDLDGFKAAQVKFIKMYKDAVLGEHYHEDYRELFYMLKGRAEVILEDIETKERKTYILKQGDRLLVPPQVAHRFLIIKDSLLVGCTEKPYQSPEVNDRSYKFNESN